MRLAPRQLPLLIIAAIAVLGTAAWLTILSPTSTPTPAKQHAADASPWIDASVPARLARDVDRVLDDISTREAREVAQAVIRQARAGRSHPAAGRARSVRVFRQWAATLPTAARVGSMSIYVDRDRTGVRAATSVELVTRGYPSPGDGNTRHVVETPIDLQLERRGSRWLVTDVKLTRSGLRAMPPVTIVREGRITVVAPERSRALATDIARYAEQARVGILRDHPRIARTGFVTIYLVRDVDTARAVTGSFASHHALGFVTEERDIVLLEEHVVRGPSDATLVGLVWHEMAHVLITPLNDELPMMLREGLAEHIGIGASLRQPNVYVDFGGLRRAAISRAYPYRRMLDDDEGDFYTSRHESMQVGYHLGHATIAWIASERGGADLRRFLQVAAADGGSVAARRALGLTPEALERSVRAWVQDHPQLS